MYGQTAGESTYGGELPFWRAIVEASADTGAAGELEGVGNPIALGVAAVDADGAVAAAPVAIGTAGADVTVSDEQVLAGVVVIESSAELSVAGDIGPITVSVIESTGAFSQDAAVDTAAVAVGTANAAALADAALEPAAVGIAATGATVLSAQSMMSVTTAAGEAVPIYVAQEPEMLPLIGSYEADDLEAELKSLFILMVDTYIRPTERYVNVLGMPQHGPRELIEASLVADGLSIYGGAEVASGAGSYLLRAWRAHNPKRGLALIQTYLQLLWPNVWTMHQMWQDKEEDYPTALSTEDGGHHYLTSRVNVSLPARVTSGGDLNSIQSGLRAALPARIVMELAIESEENIGIGIANAFFSGAVMQSYEGTIA